MKMKIDMENLKKNMVDMEQPPFIVPEGYFEAMKERASCLPAALAERERRIRRILVPVLSTAASVALVLFGMLMFGGRSSSPSLYSESVSSTMTCDEIIDYLVYTGTSMEDVSAVGTGN